MLRRTVARLGERRRGSFDGRVALDGGIERA
jgi:hypothetical protein